MGVRVVEGTGWRAGGTLKCRCWEGGRWALCGKRRRKEHGRHVTRRKQEEGGGRWAECWRDARPGCVGARRESIKAGEESAAHCNAAVIPPLWAGGERCPGTHAE